MAPLVLAAFLATAPIQPAMSAPGAFDGAPRLAQSWSCSPRRFCTQIASCEEAEWYLAQCSWGPKLDGDSDGIPCEKLCGSAR
jgi:hypothetical protein